MKEYKVNLNIETSTKIIEDEICKLFDNIIYYIDDKIQGTSKIWILDFELDNKNSIEKQVKIIVSHILEDEFNILIKKGIRIYFDIQIYYDTYTCSFDLSSSCLNLLAVISKDIEISVSLYPTDFTSHEE